MNDERHTAISDIPKSRMTFDSNPAARISSLGATSDPPVSDVALLSGRQFNAFRKLIFNECAISLNDQKRLMLSVRISKRLRALGIRTYSEYLEYIETESGRTAELSYLINVVTTNKTDFFREPYHFTFLTTQLLPELERQGAFHSESKFRVWSAGCATGEEPYTLAFVLSDYFQNRPNCFSILATDISTDALKKAVRAVYTDSTVAPVPKVDRDKYMMKGSGDWAGYWRVSPDIRRKVQFGQLNFSDSHFGIVDTMHVVFCRNVIIYFSEQTKAAVIGKLSRQLCSRGHLFIGHSETLHHLSDEFEPVERTVYRKKT